MQRLPTATLIALAFFQSHALRIEDQLIRKATPLVAAPTPAATSEMLLRHGVARFNGVLDALQCEALKSHMFGLRGAAEDPTMQRWNVWMGASDSRYVPGSRIRFTSVLEEQLTAERSDVMLPLEDALVADALRTAASKLRRTLWEGSAALPADFNGVASRNGASDGEMESLREIEMVECGALLAMPGASHQALHADYRRDNVLMVDAADVGGFRPLLQLSEAATASKRPDMPPRLVVFLYLQDVDTKEHGPTVFLPGTANGDAHSKVLHSDGTVQPGSLDEHDTIPWMATVKAGDAVIYDASVLHYGSANTVEGNDRAVFYFGISRAGHALQCAGPVPDGWTPTEPVKLIDYC